ncbi:MAG TPA: DUF1566 domain-containing protein [Spirochaetota bacterium]|nr:DUF1566 domain-containing protein [Spirochaetota bacterium]HRZ25773.1 DUF1566 domain-containing protein [Spirochaetota bacterium]
MNYIFQRHVLLLLAALLAFGACDEDSGNNSGAGGYRLLDEGPAGGLIFYINPNPVTWKYLEAAPASSESSGIIWGKHETFLGGTGSDIGTGAGNTALIVNLMNTEPAVTNTAAQVCNSLSINGYDDWFLPSLNELEEMCWVFEGKRWDPLTETTVYNPDFVESVGSFNTVGAYWSSTEVDAFCTRYVQFENGYMGWDGAKDSLSAGGYVRAIRAF